MPSLLFPGTGIVFFFYFLQFGCLPDKFPPLLCWALIIFEIGGLAFMTIKGLIEIILDDTK